MANEDGKFAWVVSLARVLAFAVGGWLAVSTVVTVAIGIPVVVDAPTLSTIAPFILAVVGQVLGIALVAVLYGIIAAIVSNEQAVKDLDNRLTRMEPLANDAVGSLKTLTDLASLTDRAKGYIYREHEIEALRETIHHHIMLQNYDAAVRMIEDMEEDFGYRQEAAAMRAEVEASRKATLEEKIDASISRFQEILDRHDWARARREADRMIRLMPDSEKIAALPGRIEAARTAHKRQLLQAYGEAIRKNDVDRGIDLLRQLDPYLTPQEAAALQESARGVFRAKLQNLGFQFTIHVTDQRWADAIAVGQEIIHDFPNSRMATEVREKMGLLKARASGTAAAKD